MTINRIKQTTVVEQVMSKIKKLIASGAYKPGDKIPTEHELAESFGVGRSSIREAIKIFNYLGVLESQAAKGTYVQERSNISREALTWSLLLGNDDINEMVDLRGAIELWAVFNLSSKVSNNNTDAAEIISRLEAIISDMTKAAAAKDKKKLIEADFQFHYTILTGNDNALFLSLFETLKSFLYNEIKESQMKYHDLGKIPQEHKILLEAIKSGNPYEAYTGHIANIKEKLRKK